MKWRSASFLLFALAFLVPQAAFAAAAPKLEVGGWIPYWRAATGTLDVMPHLAALTTVHPFGYTVAKDGTVYDTAIITQDPWKTFIQLAKVQKVRVIPTVMWSDADAMHAVLSHAASRQKLEDDIAALVHENGFDGIDIDFEGKKAETRPYFSLFLKGLYQRVGKQWLYCTIESRTPLSSRYDTIPKNIEYANDFVAINNYCDRVQIMAYDQGTIDLKLNKAADGPYAPVADKAWVEKVMTVAAQTISKRKLILGIPTYGYEYQVTPLALEGYSYKILWSFNPGYAQTTAAQFGITPQRNSAGELSFSYIPTTTPTISPANIAIASQAVGPASIGPAGTFNVLDWSDAQAVADKIAVAKKLGVRGVAIFKFDGGEDQNIWNVLPKK